MKFTGRGIIQNPGGKDIGYDDEIPQKLQERLGKNRIEKMKKSGEIDGRDNYQSMMEKVRENQKKSGDRESARHKPGKDESKDEKKGFLGGGN